MKHPRKPPGEKKVHYVILHPGFVGGSEALFHKLGVPVRYGEQLYTLLRCKKVETGAPYLSLTVLEGKGPKEIQVDLPHAAVLVILYGQSVRLPIGFTSA
jgi:hypothetical protein